MLQLFPMLLLWTFLLAGMSSCVNDMGEVESALEHAQPSVEKGKDVEMIYSEDGNVKMRLKSKRVTRYVTEEPYIEFNDGIEVFFYDDFMRVTSTLTADYAMRDEKTEQTIIRKNVVVVNAKGEELTTEELIWEPAEEKIYSDKLVHVRNEDEVIWGTGFEADEEFTRYKFQNPKGMINVKMDEEAEEDSANESTDTN